MLHIEWNTTKNLKDSVSKLAMRKHTGRQMIVNVGGRRLVKGVLLTVAYHKY